jgi:hypothetical protein
MRLRPIGEQELSGLLERIFGHMKAGVLSANDFGMTITSDIGVIG